MFIDHGLLTQRVDLLSIPAISALQAILIYELRNSGLERIVLGNTYHCRLFWAPIQHRFGVL